MEWRVMNIGNSFCTGQYYLKEQRVWFDSSYMYTMAFTSYRKGKQKDKNNTSFITTFQEE